jgi:hypothetical protein
VKSDTLIAPALDDRELELFEAEFLRGASSLSTAFPARVERLGLSVGRPARDEEAMRITRYKTFKYCCG